MISQDQAYAVMEPLAVAFQYSEDQFALWMNMMQGLQSPEAARWAAQTLIRNAENTFVPGWGAFQAIYDSAVGKIAALEAEKTLEIEESGRNNWPTPREGLEIARQAYEKAHHRPASTNIWEAVGSFDDESTSSEDVAAAVAVLRAGQPLGEHRVSSFRDVCKQRTISWANNGTLVLLGGSRD
jgi:hypothetical protein